MSKCQFCGKKNPPEVETCVECGATFLDRDREEPPSRPHSLEEELLDLLRGGQKIAAIKRYREENGVGLKEAKDAVELLAVEHEIAPTGGGCAGVLLLLLAAVVLWAF